MHGNKQKSMYTKNSLFMPHSWRGSQNKNYDTVCKGYLFIYLFILCLFRKHLLSHFMCTLSESLPFTAQRTPPLAFTLTYLLFQVQFRLSLLLFFYSFHFGLAKMLIHSALTSVSVLILHHLKHATCDCSTYYSINVWFWISLSLSLFHFC